MPCLVLLLCSVAVLQGAEFSGRWSFTWDTEGGIRQNEMEFLQDGSVLTVRLNGQELTGSVDGDTFRFEGQYRAAEAGYASMLKVEGMHQADGTLTGRGTWDQYGMTFTAKRVP